MTAIPAATEEDFKNLQKLEAWHSACVVRMSGKVIADSWQESLGSAVRLLSHYQRENERLARQRDVLRKYIRGIAGDHALEVAKGWNETELIDALSGEGGGV